MPPCMPSPKRPQFGWPEVATACPRSLTLINGWLAESWSVVFEDARDADDPAVDDDPADEAGDVMS